MKGLLKLIRPENLKYCRTLYGPNIWHFRQLCNVFSSIISSSYKLLCIGYGLGKNCRIYSSKGIFQLLFHVSRNICKIRERFKVKLLSIFECQCIMKEFFSKKVLIFSLKNLCNTQKLEYLWEFSNSWE